MNRKYQMDANTAAIQRTNVIGGRFASVESDESGELSLIDRWLVDLRAKTMVQPTKPYWNTTMVTAWVAVICGIVTLACAVTGGIYFAYNQGREAGLEQGKQEQRILQQNKEMDGLRDELKKAQEKAQRAMDVAGAR